jgi:cytoskeletal protein CcmA (bactofilin family)
VAIFGKKRETVEDKPELAAQKVAAPGGGEARKEGAKPGSEGSRLVVGSNVRLTGSEISDCDTAIVEGHVEATVDGRVMQITETGMFTGTVAIDMAEIRGQFNGELTVRKRLTVCGTGKVKGKIRYGTLVVEEGGELSGDVDSLATTPTTTAGKSPTIAPAAPVSVNKPEVVQGYSSRGVAG